MTDEIEELHSLDVAIDCSITNTVFAIGKDGKPFIKVHAVDYKNDDHYFVYTVTHQKDGYYTVSNDTFCDRKGLMQWLIDHNHIKTRAGAEGFLNREIWRAHYHYLEVRPRAH